MEENKSGGWYRWYVLAVLTAALAFSLIDRQILSILAGPIKADLHLSDAELGLLFGTTFAVFYSLFGVPLGRLADSWVRTRLMALGLLGWSLLTICSGFAANLTQLAVARIGVGIGEASANPSAYSLLSDYFPKERRATALAIYSCGITIGIGTSLWAGGAAVDFWKQTFGTGPAPFDLKPWQAAFVIVGAPGLLVAALVWSLREPPRGGMPDCRKTNVFAGFWSEVFAILPPFTLANLVLLRASRKTWRNHVLVAAGIALVAVAMMSFADAVTPDAKRHVLFHIGTSKITGHNVQWTVLGIGFYGIFSWAQSLRLRDPPTFALIWRSTPMVALLGAVAFAMITNYGLTAWTPFYAVTKYHLPLARVGMELGIVGAIFGILGTSLFGLVADAARRFSPRGRLYVSLVSMMSSVLLVPAMLSAPTLETMLVWWALASFVFPSWLSGIAATTQELVLPRMRGTSAATLTLSMTMIGLGLGPYSVGLISDATGDLRFGMLSIYCVVPAIAACMIVAIAGLEGAEKSLTARAIAADEAIDP